jgi:Flp pilus assembly protein TadB
MICAVSLIAVFLAVSTIPTEAIAEKRVKNSTRTSVNNNRNTNINTNRNTNVNVNSRRDVNVDIDVDHDRHHHHPIGTAAAITATAVVTAAVVGSVVHTIPPSCVPVQVGNMIYQQCGTTWYQPQYAGSSVQYVVITPPR